MDFLFAERQIARATDRRATAAVDRDDSVHANEQRERVQRVAINSKLTSLLDKLNERPRLDCSRAVGSISGADSFSRLNRLGAGPLAERQELSRYRV
jgi:hypothetical protein